MEEEKKDEEEKGTWDAIVDSTKKYAKLAKEEIVKSSKIGKVRLEITKIKKQKSKKFQELGEHCFRLLKENTISIEGAEALKDEINKLDAELKEKEAVIEEIQKMAQKESEE